MCTSVVKKKNKKWGTDFITAALLVYKLIVSNHSNATLIVGVESDTHHGRNWIFRYRNLLTTHLGTPIFEIHILNIRTCAG